MNNQNYNNYNNHNNYNNYNRYNDPRALYNEESTNETRTSSKISPRTLMIMAVVFILIGLLSFASQYNQREIYNSLSEGGNFTYGDIMDVDRRTTTSGSTTGYRKRGSSHRTKKTEYHVSGIYIVEDQIYNFSFTSSSHYTEGETIKIFYEKGNPSNYVREGDDGDSLIVCIIPIVIGGIMGVVGFRKHREIKELKAMGLL